MKLTPLVLALASCAHPAPPPAPATASAPVAGPPAAAPLGAPLRGPTPTLDGDVADIAPTGALPEGLLELKTLYLPSEPDGDLGCAVALRTAAGWFVGPPSAEICREPSYRELQSVAIDTDEHAVATITYAVEWHTKDGEESESYQLTARCQLAGATPRCTAPAKSAP